MARTQRCLLAVLGLALTACRTETPADQDDTNAQPGDGGASLYWGRPDQPPDRAPVYTTSGFFLDGPVAGLGYHAGNTRGLTDADGALQYLPGRPIQISVGDLELGQTWGQPRSSPLDLLPGQDLGSASVQDLARFLQSLDQDGDPSNGIVITAQTAAVVNQVLAGLGRQDIDWADSEAVQALISGVVVAARDLPGHALVEVDRAAAGEHLRQTLWSSGLYRSRLSQDPTLASDKVRLDLLPALATSRSADGEVIGGPDGVMVAPLVAPLIAHWLEQLPGTGAKDVFLGVSLDQGLSWWSTNPSQSASRSSFTRADGTVVLGDASKPVVKVVGDRFVATWTDLYCPERLPGGGTEAEDVYGAHGLQGSVNYTLDGRPDLGEVPYACLWAARGRVDAEGRITVLAAQPLTSGTRDAIQQVVTGVKDVGFIVTWQEDPLGLRLGEGTGPGDGMSGASVNPGTDIWMSTLGWGAAVAETGTDDGLTLHRLVQPAESFSVPVRLSDNARCQVSDGQVWVGDPYCLDLCATEGPDGSCLTAQGASLDGTHGASRPSIFATSKSVSNPEGGSTKTAQVVIAYEESLGGGGSGGEGGEGGGTCVLAPRPPDTGGHGGGGGSDGEASGKGIVYHAFDLLNPNRVSAGTLISDPTLSARRVRVVGQPSSQVGPADLRLVVLYREGQAGEAAPAGIRMRRAVGGMSASNLTEVVNLSSPVRVLADRDQVPGPFTWQWTEAALHADPLADPFDSARAHRAALRGDNLLVAWTWTSDDAAAAQGEAAYDLFLRRSFDGGQTWTDANGVYEPPRNITALSDASITIVEPRIVGTPGTVSLADGSASPDPGDTQDPDVVYLAWGTSTNLGYDETDTRLDLYWTRSTDVGETWSQLEQIDPRTGEPVSSFALLAGGDEIQAESQLRTNPAGTVLYATWNQSLEDAAAPQSDPWFRRIPFLDP